jgi:hypothetical protein
MGFLESVQSVASIAAVAIGGVWAYIRLSERRERLPRARITHTIHSFPLDEKVNFIHLELTVENIGEVLLDIRQITIRFNKVKPWPTPISEAYHCATFCNKSQDRIITQLHGLKYPWPQLKEYQVAPDPSFTVSEIEPKESETFPCDLFLDKDVEIVQIHSYIQNHIKRHPFDDCEGKEIGWKQNTFYSIPRSNHERPRKPQENAAKQN